MKNRSIIALALITLMSFSTIQLSAYSQKTSKNTMQNKPMPEPYSAKASSYAKATKDATKGKQKKPEYYRPGHSDGLQNWPGKTIDAGANTGMLPTNSSSPLMGNDITF